MNKSNLFLSSDVPAEEPLGQNQPYLQVLFDEAPIGVFLLDGDLRIQAVKPKASPTFGNIPGLIGRDFSQVMHILWSPATADRIVSHFRHTLETGEPFRNPEFSEERHDRKQREYYDWQIHRITVPDSRKGVVCYFKEISAPVLARKAAAESEERLRFMAESMPQKIFTATAKGDVDYFNQQWTEFTGLSFEQIKNWGWTQFIHPEDVEENIRLWEHSINTGEPFEFVHRFRRSDGIYRWHLSRAHAQRDAAGNISIWMGSNTDIHERREIEEQLRQANTDLEQFAFLASHDLQEPIRNIAIYSQILARRYEATLDARGQECLGFITDGVLRLEMLVKDLLAYTRAANLEGDTDEVAEAASALDNALSNLSASIAETGALVTSDILPTVRMKTVHLQQVFQNLIGNALKYRSDASPRVRVSADREADFWRFSVQDNGLGIKPRVQGEDIWSFQTATHHGPIPRYGYRACYLPAAH